MVMASASYEPDYDAPHASRVFVREFLAGQGANDLTEVGQVLMSELVSNVVRRAHSPIEIDLMWENATLRAEVRDGSSILPGIAELAGADGGYGLTIVEALSQDWGMRQLAHGKAVWFTLERPPSPLQ
jgi:anti-sigma regulatory factor (Ser/Thr protein kinase)